MSRSFKHVPIIKYGGYGKIAKHWANKRVRKTDIDDGNKYRKLYESWDIFDIKDNLYRIMQIDKIPYHKWLRRFFTIEEINEYWKK